MDILERIAGFAGDILIIAGTEYGQAAQGVGAVTNKIPEWIVCPSGISITTLEEKIDGVSTDVLAQHGLTSGQALPANYILKSSRGAGFSRILITGGNANGFVISPERNRNFTNSPNSGIYSAG